MDEKVLAAQRWVNSTYSGVSGYNRCPEDGKTGWSTMYSLTRALQHELGVAPLSDSFGVATLAELVGRGAIGPGFSNRNIVRIVQHALFCKGYWGGDGQGDYDQVTMAAVENLKADAGLWADPFSKVEPKIFKAILTMDAYRLVPGGTEEVRTVQRALNGIYFGKSTFFLMPCDGYYSRDVQRALMKAIQYEIGIPEDQANGNFGPGTEEGLRRNPVSPDSSVPWVRLFSAACVLNGEVNGAVTTLKVAWDAQLAGYVQEFQRFSALDETGYGDFATWAQLLVSTGDPDREGRACDTSRTITPARARDLYAAGYRVIGRYLDEDPGFHTEKPLRPAELDALFDARMRIFPISQYFGRDAGSFTYDTGYQHGLKAHEKAAGVGFNPGTVIYFAVDYDATTEEINTHIIPYFQGIVAALVNKGERYIHGVYGSRNVCTMVTNATGARWSFVSGMSWGFSGNLGFPMPSNWAYNQIQEFEFTGPAGTFPLDKDVWRPDSDPASASVHGPGVPGLQDWASLVSFRPPGAMQTTLNARFGGLFGPSRVFHSIEDARGRINLDYYPVRIREMPKPGRATMSAFELLEHVRRHINDFVDGCHFAPYDPSRDKAAWLPPRDQLAHPGAVLSIDFPVAAAFGLNLEDGSVALSEVAPDHWIFSTLWTPDDQGHPVSGNRYFGLKEVSAGELIFYTRGADRLTSVVDELAGEIVFDAGHQVWLSLQSRVADYVNENRGTATKESVISKRHDWTSVQKKYFRPTERWVS